MLKRVLRVATADLDVVRPDFIVPNGFLFLPRGSVRLGASESRYDALPGSAIWEQAINNSAYELYEFIKVEGMPAGVNPIVEYHNAESSLHDGLQRARKDARAGVGPEGLGPDAAEMWSPR